jgi:hypothetical protein
MDQYEAYRREIALTYAQRPGGGQQVQQMPLYVWLHKPAGHRAHRVLGNWEGVP